MMSVGLGFFCSTSRNELTTNRVLRLRNLSGENVLRIFEKNLEDFKALLKMSCSMGLTIFRLGSNIIPLASRPEFREEWFQEIEERLRRAAPLVKEMGVRITMHPGQYVVLNSPRSSVVESSLRELEYHFRVLDALGAGAEGVVVVHLGGVFGDKAEALKRFKRTVEDNPWLRRRLAVENDERYYTASDALSTAEDLGIPVVFDHYHHTLNPSAFDMDRVFETWRNTTPEFHISSRPDKPHRFGEHGDYVKPEDFLDMLFMIGGRGPVDVIVEAKKKEHAVKRLISELEKAGVRLREPPCVASYSTSGI